METVVTEAMNEKRPVRLSRFGKPLGTPKCGFRLDHENARAPLKCTRAVGHTGEHECSAKTIEGGIVRFRW